MPGSGQSSVGRVESISFKFGIPYICGRVIHIRHLEEVFGASVLMHFNGFSAPFLGARVLGVLGIRGHLEISTFKDEFAYVIFIFSATGDNQCNAQDKEKPTSCCRNDHSDELIGISTVETTKAEWTTHTGFIFKSISIFTSSAGVIHLVELKVARLALAQGDTIQVSTDGGLFVTLWTLPLAQAARSEDPCLRAQDSAGLSGGPAGVDKFLNPIIQVKERYIGGQ